MRERKPRGRSAVRLENGSRGGESLTPPSSQHNEDQAAATKRGDDVKLRILTAALDYFGNLGFDGATTRAIAEQADVTHSLVMYHFKNKEGLWTATFEHAIASYKNDLKIVSSNEKKERPDVLLRRLIEMFVRLHAGKPQIHRFMIAEGGHHSLRLDWLIQNFLTEHFTIWHNIIRKGQDNGTVRSIDPTQLYYLIISAGGTIFTLSKEYEFLTGRNIFSEAEILRHIALMYEIVFTTDGGN